jgi:hypothetical protein
LSLRCVEISSPAPSLEKPVSRSSRDRDTPTTGSPKWEKFLRLD